MTEQLFKDIIRMPEKRLSTWEVLRYKFPENEYVLITEVSDASGFSRNRSLDYMTINLWESRGLAVTGIEQKSNRGDWLKELKNPKKQENHFKYCDYFYLLTDREDIAKLDEIPPTWGWYHINKSQILKTIKPAPKLNPKPIGRSLMCAMLRRAASKEKFVHVDTLETQIALKAESIYNQKNNTLEREAAAYRTLRERVDEFEKASGLRIGSGWDYPKKIGDAVNIIMNGGVEQHIENLERLERQINNIHEGLLKNLSIIKEQTAEV